MSIHLTGSREYSQEAGDLSVEIKRLIEMGENTPLEAMNYLNSEDTWTGSYERSTVEESFEYLKENDESISKLFNISNGEVEYRLNGR